MTQAGEYYKTAASHLRHAVEARQLDINALRKSVSDRDSEIRKSIQEIEKQIQQKEADIARSHSAQREPLKDKPSKLRDVVRMHGMLTDMKRDLDKYRAEVQTQIGDLEREINDTNRLISDLERHG